MVYAIVEASGKQMFLRPGNFYDFNYIPGEPGDIVNLKCVLLVNNMGSIHLGTPCVKTSKVQAIILKHLRGSKVTVFKMKSKKNTRVKQGHRQDLTRLLIKQIIF
uniref:50S ribosomal protein L21, chloroplastic n=1 Tax=Asparagopsis taxiformis TaxID=260499 RepID=A0A1C9CCB8_9FLOR|nr:ribosomal protein L21 [Asparagopsis taxiformis]AOM65994.1 ribosomal protein L21 [Asparagopsis taxiformis]